MIPTAPRARLVLLFNRASVEAQKIELRSIEAMQPSTWQREAIAGLRERIARQEAILAKGGQ